MKPYIFALLAIVSLSSHAIYKLGETPADKGWADASGKIHKLSETRGKVSVLLHSAGWCRPCNEEIKSLVPKSEREFAGKDVVFYSLSCDGWKNASGVTKDFLLEWDKAYSISACKANWLVLNSMRDCGKSYFRPGSGIPNVAILDKDGKLVFSGVGPSPEAVISTVKKYLK